MLKVLIERIIVGVGEELSKVSSHSAEELDVADPFCFLLITASCHLLLVTPPWHLEKPSSWLRLAFGLRLILGLSGGTFFISRVATLAFVFGPSVTFDLFFLQCR